jgi:hypothetical protein
VLEGTVIRVEVAHLGDDSDAPIYFSFGAVDDKEDVEDPTVEGDGFDVVGYNSRLALPVRRTPESSLDQIVVKLISSSAAPFSVSAR